MLIYEISVHPSYKEIIKEFIRRKPPGRNMHVKGKRAISQVIYKKNGRAEALPFNNPIRQKRSACGLADAYIQRKCFMRYRAKKWQSRSSAISYLHTHVETDTRLT